MIINKVHLIKKAVRLLFTNPTALYYKLKHVLCKTVQDRGPIAANYSNVSLIFDYTQQSLSFIPDIVIPIYNGYEYLVKLVSQLLSHNHITYHIILVNDCSTDHNILTYLDQIKHNLHHEITILHNSKNLGFVKTVNIGMKYVKNHFIILNTDTEVPRDFATKLLYPIVENPKIASTTPYTNSGTICSFPVICEDNQIFMGLDVQTIDNAFNLVNSDYHNQKIPTGVGFCMGINKEVYNKIGGFDEITFGRGYGEENDWCMRAINTGYINLHVTNCFVYHKHGGSFEGSEKRALIQQNYARLIQRHRNYESLVSSYIANESNKDLRIFMQLLLLTKSVITTCIFNTVESGGSKSYLTNFVNQHKDEQIIVLVESKCFLTLCDVKVSYQNYFLEFKTNQIFSLLKQLSVNFIKVNHLIFDNSDQLLQSILEFKSSTNSQLHVMIHDYFYICPTVNLLNKDNVFCGVPNDTKVCNTCLSGFTTKSYCSDYVALNATKRIMHWRYKFWPLLNSSDKIIVPSSYVRELLLKVYPELENKIEVRVHELGYLLPISQDLSYIPFISKPGITVGVLGGIGFHKGSAIVHNMIKLAKAKDLKMNWVVIGDIYPYEHYDSLKVTGSYKVDSLMELVNKYKPDIFVCTSIWPETFCYTASEIMHTGLPLVSFNLGAQAERVAKYSKGVLVDDISADAMLEAIIDYSKCYSGSSV